MKPIRVGVFDEHEIFRRGAVACVAEDPGLRMVAEGPTAWAEELDVAVVSPTVAEEGKLDCPLVVCGGSERLSVSLQDNASVAAVFRRQTMVAAQLVNAVRAAAVGLQVQSADERMQVFDNRSLAVLELLADGAATREISDRLGYSERTIKGLIQEIEHELGARSRAHAVALAMRKRLI